MRDFKQFYGIYMALFWAIIAPSLSKAANDCLPFGDRGVILEGSQQVVDYKSVFLSCLDSKDKKLFVLRQFQLNGVESALVLDPDNLKTQLTSSTCLQNCRELTDNEYASSVYGRIHSESVSPPFPLQNDGITTGLSNKVQIAVTIDMCPSKKGISQNVYDKLKEQAIKNKKAFPVGIALTKKWMNTYPKHFRWLKEQVLDGVFDVLWINHSDTHPYKSGVALNKNFLLSKNVDFTSEVLGTEISFIEAGITPSLFFRFPGLVSSQELIENLADWGLIPLGSNVWLAKGEKPQKSKSIILIHGNRNEPEGETIFLNYVETKSADIAWASLLNLLGI